MRGIRLAAATCGLALAATGCLRTRPVDPARLGTPALTSKVVAADGSLLTTLHAEIDRRPVPLTAIPKVLVDAVLAVEDRRFYEHDGVDVRGIARAAVRDVADGERQGGSTITQQLVKNTLVTPERTVKRKVREAALALGLERSLTKDQILERYLNTVYFGQGAYGVGAASRVYFGHNPEALTLPEAALLAGLIRSPNTADPVRAPAAAQARRAVVLRSMVETGAITPEEAAEAGTVPVPRKAVRDDTRYAAPYAVDDAVRALLADPRLGPTQQDRHNALFRGGLTVRLTIDPEHQRRAEEAVASVLTERADPYAGLAAVKPGDGAITAMVGGRDFFAAGDPQAKVNLARGGTTKRQAGSTFKVFTLVAALEAGVRLEDRFEAGSRAVLPRKVVRTPWDVDNYEGTAFGRITLRSATESSVNTAYARVVQRIGGGDVDAGTAKVVDVAERFGVRGRDGARLRRDPAVTLGAQEVDPVEMAAAYAALAAGGTYAQPYLVASVTDSRGREILRNTPRRKQVTAPGVAMLVNDALQGVVRDGTGARAALSRPVAGKTGTSSAYHDAWFVGYTPSFAAAVWVGVPSRQVSMRPENGFRTIVAGGTFPALIWGRFAAAALAGTPVERFEDAAGATVRIDVDVERGCLPNRWTLPGDVEKRVFLRGTEPKTVCREPTGPAATEVPALLGLTADRATALLGGAGFRYEVVEVFDPTFRVGVVVGQQPASGSTVAAGSTVVVRVSGGRAVDVVVPDVLGLDADVARSMLLSAGLRAAVSIAPSCTGGSACETRLRRESGRVWRQDLPAGTKVRAGSSVGLAVGPRFTPAPPSAQPAEPSPTASPSASPTP